MKYILQISTIIGFAILVNIAVPQFAEAQQKATYKVEAGDTFFSISKSLKVTVAELKEWNDVTSNNLAIGQELVYYITEPSAKPLPKEDLPEATSMIQSPADATRTFYLVKSGDTLFRIAQQNGMSVSELKTLNDLTTDNLRIGQRLAIKSVSIAPVVNEFSDESSSQGKFALYTLNRSDNLNTILSKFKMTEAELQALNPDINTRQLNLANKITVLLPPTRNFANPYSSDAQLQDLGSVTVMRYDVQNIGKTTTNGELYNPDEFTAAHSNIALGSIIFVENPVNGKGVYVRINDRITGTGLKLSSQAFRILGFDANQQPTATIYTDS
ncbi:MAG: LysM peptidoglycan-binding domain-containing protein [Balneolaceae bacterium]